MVTRHGQFFWSLKQAFSLIKVSSGESKPFIRNVFTLNTCAHIVGSQVLEFKDERQLLLEWRKFVETVDPDMIIGYNISNFDLPYLLDRAKALKIPDFAFLGRLRSKSRAKLPTSVLAFLINLLRCQDRNQGNPLFFKSLWSARFQSR